MAVELFEQECAYFEAHKDDLLAQHRDQFAVIKGDRLIGLFPTHRAAYEAGLERLGNVDMLIRRLTEEEPQVTLPFIVVYADRSIDAE